MEASFTVCGSPDDPVVVFRLVVRIGEISGGCVGRVGQAARLGYTNMPCAY